MESPVISGLGIVTASSKNIDAFDNALRRSAVGVNSYYSHPQLAFSVPAALLSAGLSLASLERSYPWLERKRLYGCLRKASPSLLSTVAAVLEAYQQAQLVTKPVEAMRVGLVVAGSQFDQTDTAAAFDTFQKAPAHMTPQYALSALDNYYEGIMSELLQIQGETVSVSGASASGNVALLQGQRMLQVGSVDVCLVVGVMASVSAPWLQALYQLGALGGVNTQRPPGQVCCPFDKAHQGFIYGQGAGCVVLEQADSVKQRGGVTSHSTLVAATQCVDGNHLSDPNQAGEARAMQLALDQAGLTPENIDYINAHATSTPMGDVTELAACREVFQKHLDSCWLNSTKALTGHCLVLQL